jgi:aldose sugar dehydrogenase
LFIQNHSKYIKSAPTTVLVFVFILGIVINPNSFTVFGSAEPRIERTSDSPEILDPNLKVEEIVEGLELPTSMAFLGPDDILVLEKDKGTVRRIVDGQLLPEAVLDVNVANQNERGMLGIAVKNTSQDSQSEEGTDTKIAVYLTFTESEEDGNDVCSSSIRCEEGNEPLGNRLYRYEFENDKLVNPQLLLDLPATPGPAHNGGVVVVGPDDNLYVNIGDVRGSAQNPAEAQREYDGRSGILRVTQDGQPVGEGILGDEHPLNFYYAYGIRNSFGMDFDPLTGNLWDTENSVGTGDEEINLALPGFNSGWRKVMGFSSENPAFDAEELEDFDGKGEYMDPQFVWGESVGPTALKFLNSDKLGEQYQNDMFVGDINNGFLYHFELDEDRTGLALSDVLADKSADTVSELQGLIFGKGFGGITDIEVGPDGYLYVVSIGLGKIFRIIPGSLLA